MFKALLLQSGYGLSDPGLEKQLARDLLFRRFVGLDISESVPDHSTFWRFRQKLEKVAL
ncbi:transposase, partial [Beggiatoa alba]|nr:transposase [Beggiatoa alba]